MKRVARLAVAGLAGAAALLVAPPAEATYYVCVTPTYCIYHDPCISTVWICIPPE